MRNPGGHFPFSNKTRKNKFGGSPFRGEPVEKMMAAKQKVAEKTVVAVSQGGV